jgi:hypothetical protein
MCLNFTCIAGGKVARKSNIKSHYSQLTGTAEDALNVCYFLSPIRELTPTCGASRASW